MEGNYNRIIRNYGHFILLGISFCEFRFVLPVHDSGDRDGSFILAGIKFTKRKKQLIKSKYFDLIISQFFINLRDFILENAKLFTSFTTYFR